MPFSIGDFLIGAAQSALASRIGSSSPSGDGRLRTAGGMLASDAVRLLAPPPPSGGPVADFYIPPGGFTGFAQMTPASKAALSSVGRSRRRKRRKKAKQAVRRARSTARRAARRAVKKRFVKGSAAAKRHMAKLRRMRK